MERLLALSADIVAHLRTSGPHSEISLSAWLIGHGVTEAVMDVDSASYAAWLRTLTQNTTQYPAFPWRSVQSEIDSGRAALHEELQRTTSAISTINRTQLTRDIGVACGVFLAAGAGLACPVIGGFSRASVLRHGWETLTRSPSLIVRMLRTRLRIELHTNARLVHQFTEASWSRMYETLRVTLATEDKIDAAVAIAWHLDEQVAVITPHLAYTRRIPASLGAVFIDLPATEADTKYALHLSPMRRVAFKNGSYRPHPTFMYWQGR